MNEKSPRPPIKGALHTFNAEIHGTWNGMIIRVGGRNFVVQMTGSHPEDFEPAIEALREAFAHHMETESQQPTGAMVSQY